MEATNNGDNADTPDTDENAASESRGLGLSEPLLQDPHRMYEDLRLAERARKERWPIGPAKRAALVDRLVEVVEKRSVKVFSAKTGEVEEIDQPADVNAIAAARVLVSMESQNQADQTPSQGGTNVNVSVSVGSSVQTVLSQEPEYLEWLRQRSLEEGRNPDAVGEDGDCGKVLDAAAYPRIGSGGD